MELERERDNQGWIYDWVVKMSGRAINFAYDAKYLPPEVKSFAMIPRALEKQGRHLDALAAAAEEAGHRETACALYTRAIVPYFFAQNAIYRDDDQEKIYLHGRILEAFDGVMRTAPYHIERVEIPFDGGVIQANYHQVPGVASAPAVLFCPGMDMTKEAYPTAPSNDFVQRGMHVLSMDGPGQGISNIRKLRLTLDNYEKAGQAAISWLCERSEVDEERIGVFGVSMGSHWGTQIAATDPRVKAVATAMACYTSKRLIFDVDAPRFKRIFMYMTGIHDEATFDEFAAAFTLDPYFAKMRCATLMVHGEFDPLSDIEEAIALYETIDAPKELWVLEDDFHEPRGIDNFGGMDVHPFAADWLRDAMDGRLAPDHKREVLVHKKAGSGPFGPQMGDFRLPGRIQETPR